MKNYSSDELMIQVRKQEEKKRPKPGELLQGIFFSLWTAIEHLEGANTLIKDKKPLPAFGLFIGAIEELGKISKFADLIISWSEPHKIQEYKKKQKDHVWKLTSALELVKKLIQDGKIEITIKGNLSSFESFGQDPLNFLMSLIDPEAAEQYHKMRLDIAYSNFDGQRVFSPYHSINSLSPENLEIAIPFLQGYLDTISKACDVLLPIYVGPIRECYLERDLQKINTLKNEINRRVYRTLPAIRKHIDTKLIKNFGIGLDEIEADKAGNFYKSEDPMAELREVLHLIISHDKIEEIFFFPPLKESAKEYYKSLTIQQ
ncbi:hypothetical protein BDW_10195 [Bdellovibrio bacteriovorus W]|nr:hypothetical protein BDW_10195 [Bdellovibrio bacteriovorus W]